MGGAIVCANPSKATVGPESPIAHRVQDYEDKLLRRKQKEPNVANPDIETLNDMTCLGFNEIRRLKKNFKTATHGTRVLMNQDVLSIFWGVNAAEHAVAIERMYRAFNLTDHREGFSFSQFILVIDSIIGFNYAKIRLTFTTRYFGLDKVKSITTSQLKQMYDDAKIFASNPSFFTPLELRSDRETDDFEDRRANGEPSDGSVAPQKQDLKVDMNSLMTILDKRSDLWTFLLPDESLKTADFSE